MKQDFPGDACFSANTKFMSFVGRLQRARLFLRNSSRLDAALFGPRTSITNGFWRDKFAFPQRTLTYESDILDTFRGILNRSPFVTFWGVPITPLRGVMDPHIGFALGLLWIKTPNWTISRHLESSKERPRIRRVSFPT